MATTATKSKKSTRTPREIALLPVKDVPAAERTPVQKLERRLLSVLYSKRTAADAEAKAALTKVATKLERQIKTAASANGASAE